MLPLFLIVVAIAAATWAGWEIWRISGSSSHQFIQRQVRYQAAFFLVALFVAVLANAFVVQGSGVVFGIGELGASAWIDAFNFLHVEGGSWLEIGGLLTIAFGLATCFLVLPSLRGIADWPEFFKKFGRWIIVLASINALSEELIYRGAVVSVAQGRLESFQTALLSAVLFALAHVRGQAFGIIVVAGSAVVGWFLAYAVLQTHGLFWAWCMHFTQDVLIFAGLIASAAANGAPAGNREFAQLS